LSHTKYTVSHSYDGATVADGSFPIVIYSHGWTGFRTVALNQIESLVSNGYIVIAADHTYGAIATVFPDGEVVKADPAALPDETTVDAHTYNAAAQTLINVFANDITSLLDALDEGESGPFARVASAADVTRIGIYGHSTGGGAAVEVCLEDPRCDAVLGMDPWVEPLADRTLAATPSRPAMFLRSDEWRGNDNDAVLRGIAGRNSDSPTYWVGIEGTHHNDFVITPLFSPIAGRLGLKGPIPEGRIIPIIDRYLVGFFDVFLLGTGSAAIDTPSFDEVSVEIIPPA
jgi:dienelactone hydrolase